MKKFILFCLFAVFLNGENLVSVSIAPQAFFVKKIAGDTLKINILMNQNIDEHTFELKPALMKELENSDLYFTIGLEFERAFGHKFRENFKNLHFVDMQKNIVFENLKEHSHGAGEAREHEEHTQEHSTHEAHNKHETQEQEKQEKQEHEEQEKHAQNHSTHEEQEKQENSTHEHNEHAQEQQKHNKHEEHTQEHSTHEHNNHAQKDIHTWLDPNLVKIMAGTIFEALSEKYPQNKALYQKNLENFTKELDALDAELKALFKGVKSKEFIVYHPSWGYFAKAYDLEQIPVEIEAKEPKIKDLQALIKFSKEKNIKVIFVQPGFPENAAKTLAKECGASVLSINHLALDWDDELRKSAKALAGSLK